MRVHLAIIYAVHLLVDGVSIFFASLSILKFMPKMILTFHLNQTKHLPVFFPKPHSSKAEQKLQILDVWRALAFYLDCTKSFRSSLKLTVAYAESIKGQPLIGLCISHRMSDCIKFCYDLAKVYLPSGIMAHSTMAHSTPSTFLSNVARVNICKAAMWYLYIPSPDITLLLKLPDRMPTAASQYCRLFSSGLKSYPCKETASE